MIKFEAHKKYYGRFICDSEMMVSAEIVRRTEKSIWCKVDCVGPLRMFRVSVFQDCETFFPLGAYSMAPIIRADRILVPGQVKKWSPVLELVK